MKKTRIIARRGFLLFMYEVGTNGLFIPCSSPHCGQIPRTHEMTGWRRGNVGPASQTLANVAPRSSVSFTRGYEPSVSRHLLNIPLTEKTLELFIALCPYFFPSFGCRPAQCRANTPQVCAQCTWCMRFVLWVQINTRLGKLKKTCLYFKLVEIQPNSVNAILQKHKFYYEISLMHTWDLFTISLYYLYSVHGLSDSYTCIAL